MSHFQVVKLSSELLYLSRFTRVCQELFSFIFSNQPLDASAPGQIRLFSERFLFLSISARVILADHPRFVNDFLLFFRNFFPDRNE